jgi:hypothetical protein
MGNCCSDEVGHGAGRHSVGPAASVAEAASAAADRFLRSRGAGASTQIEVRSPGHCYSASTPLLVWDDLVRWVMGVVALRAAWVGRYLGARARSYMGSCSCLCLA